MSSLIFTPALFLAYANGANDNFKGVATLYGSKTSSYHRTLMWATLTTALGSIMALYLAGQLIIIFQGKGLVPEEVIQMQNFSLAVGISAALTVMLATFFSLPVSTTHALIGALAGVGWISSETGINWVKLSEEFFLPLIGGPLISIALAFIVYPLFKKLREFFKIEQETCFCLGKRVIATVPKHVSTKEEFVNNFSEFGVLPEAIIKSQIYCRFSYSGHIVGISARKILDALHYLSSGFVCFARGLNDTPKITALLLIGSRSDLNLSILLVGAFIMIGGLIHSKRIAETMGKKVTEMNPGQAFTANLITGLMVFGASKMGLPVSTTHVSCGAIFGIGAVSKKLNIHILMQILVAWITTLPLGFIFGLTLMSVLS